MLGTLGPNEVHVNSGVDGMRREQHGAEVGEKSPSSNHHSLVMRVCTMLVQLHEGNVPSGPLDIINPHVFAGSHVG